MHVPNAEATFLREIADGFVQATQATEYSLADVVAWGLETGALEPTICDPDLVRQVHIARLSEACQKHTLRTPDGRRVRLRHSITIDRPDESGRLVQRTLWSHVNDATPEFLEESIRQRAEFLRRSAYKLQADVDYINTVLASRGARQIQLHLPLVLSDDAEDTSDVA